MIIIFFDIKSKRIDPCVVERKNRFIIVNQLVKNHLFVNKTMHNFKIGFKFVKAFFNSNLHFGHDI